MKQKLFFFATLILAFCLFTQKTFAQQSGIKPELFMLRHNNGGGGLPAPSPVLTGNTLGVVTWKGLTAINSIVTGASIRSTATLAAPGILNADMRFSTSGFERAIISAEGLVGIGTMTPLYHLDVVGNTHTSGRFYGRIHFDVGELTDLPSTYIDEAYFERKSRAQLGLSANATYPNGGILSLAPGGGSLDRQLFSGGNDGFWTRTQDAAGGNTWGAWEKILTGADINGTAGRVARFTGALGSPSNTLGNSQLFDDGTDVGIGTTTPDAAYLLTIGGDTKINGNTNTSGSTTTGSLQVGTDATVNGTTRLIGKVAIGTNPVATPGAHALYIGGSAIAEEVVVKLQTNWPDYVFESEYQLNPLAEVEKYVTKEKHLPGVPSASEIAEKGVHLGNMQKIEMEKIEELYLHLIAMEKRIQTLEKENSAWKVKVEQLEKH